MTRFLAIYWGVMLKLVMIATGVHYFHCTRTAKGYAMSEWEQRRSDFWFLWKIRNENGSVEL